MGRGLRGCPRWRPRISARHPPGAPLGGKGLDPASAARRAPPAVAAPTGRDVIAHSLDAMCSVRANPVSGGLAVRAAKLAFENLEAAFRDGSDAVARERMAMASTIAGYAFSNTGTTGSHGCSYLLTAKYPIPHGEACALTLDCPF